MKILDFTWFFSSFILNNYVFVIKAPSRKADLCPTYSA